DDNTRLAYVEVLANEQGLTAVGFLQRAEAWYRSMGIRVRGLMTDNGGAYRSRFFRAACQRLRVRQIWTRPYRPPTNGKADRFIQTLLREWAYFRPYLSSRLRVLALAPWIRYYNRRRPHGGLNGCTPLSALRGH